MVGFEVWIGWIGCVLLCRVIVVGEIWVIDGGKDRDECFVFVWGSVFLICDLNGVDVIEFIGCCKVFMFFDLDWVV